MLDPTTLVGIACLIANKGPVDTGALESQLDTTDRAKVRQLIDDGACLPENLERLIAETQAKVKNGEVLDMASEGSPTHDCR